MYSNLEEILLPKVLAMIAAILNSMVNSCSRVFVGSLVQENGREENLSLGFTLTWSFAGHCNRWREYLDWAEWSCCGDSSSCFERESWMNAIFLGAIIVTSIEGWVYFLAEMKGWILNLLDLIEKRWQVRGSELIKRRNFCKLQGKETWRLSS